MRYLNFFSEKAFVFLFFLLLFGGCNEEETITAKTVEPTFTSIQAIIFTNCALQSCHGASAKAGLNLSKGSSYDNLVNVRSVEDKKNLPPFYRVKPNSPDSSFLYIKITSPGQGQGDRMPQAGISLSQNEIAAIRQWIAEGAKNN
ncbi:MAG: hypothetical protein WDA22_07200 [Bacteroidota bacterium]